MIHTLQPPPLDLVFKPRPTTAPARLARLVLAARAQLADEPTLPALAAALACTEAEAKDAAQALPVAQYWAGRGWRLRLRSDQEQRLVAAANDDVAPARVLAA